MADLDDPLLLLLDSVYRNWLGRLSLSRDDRAALREEGLSDPEIDGRCYGSMPGRNRICVAKGIVWKFGEDVCSQVPGLYPRDRDWSITGFKGIGIPVLDTNRFVRAIVVRSVDEDGRIYHKLLTSAHKGGPGPGMPVHVPVTDTKSFERVALTDRALAADAVTVRTGMLCLAVHDAENWEAAVPVLLELDACEVLVGFRKGSNSSIAARIQDAVRKAGNDNFIAVPAEGKYVGWLPSDARGLRY